MKILSCAGDILTNLVIVSMQIGFLISLTVAPIAVFFALRTGCIPESVPLVSGWTSADCSSEDYYPHVAFWWGFMFRLVLALVALVIAGVFVASIITRKRKASKSPLEQSNPKVDEILAALRSIVSKTPRDKH